MTSSFKTKRLVESALMIALSAILSFIILFRLPFGGSITACCMLPVILVSYRYGVKWGFVTAFAFSLIQGIQGIAEGTFSAAALGVENGVFNGGFFSGSPLLAAFGIFLLDYIIAFTVLGIGGIFRDKIKNKPLALVCGILLAGRPQQCLPASPFLFLPQERQLFQPQLSNRREHPHRPVPERLRAIFS